MPPEVTTRQARRGDDAHGTQGADPIGSGGVVQHREDPLVDPLQEAAVLHEDGGGRRGAVREAAVQFEEETPPADVLDPEETRAAVKFNRRRRIPRAAWKKIAAIVGSPTDRPSPALVHAIATWQQSKGLAKDGRLGDITLQWLALEPGGESLDAQLKSEHTVYLGIRKASRGRESRALKKMMGRKNVDAVTGSDKRHEDQIKVGGQWADLTTDTGIQTFLASMPKLDAAKSKALTDFLKKSGGQTRDELAQLIGVLYGVETGQSLMKRVVLSGHSGGKAIEGDVEAGGIAKIYFAHLAGLNKVFPIAFSQVEDLMVSGCNTGHTKHLDQYRAMFPNLKTIWAYAGYSPSGTSAKGSPHHMKKWNEGTKGRGSGTMDVKRQEVAGRKALNDKNVAIWNKDDGYKTASPEASSDLTTLISSLAAAESAYTTGYVNGIIDRTALSGLQTTLQVLANNYSDSDLTPHGRTLAGIQTMNRHVMYLRHWKETAEFFVKKYGSEVKAGYDELGASQPDFTTLDRARTLAEVKSFGAKIGKSTTAGGKAAQALKRMSEILRDLDPAQIPLYE